MNEWLGVTEQALKFKLRFLAPESDSTVVPLDCGSFVWRSDRGAVRILACYGQDCTSVTARSRILFKMTLDSVVLLFWITSTKQQL